MQDLITIHTFTNNLINYYNCIPVLGIADSKFATRIISQVNSKNPVALTENDRNRITHISTLLLNQNVILINELNEKIVLIEEKSQKLKNLLQTLKSLQQREKHKKALNNPSPTPSTSASSENSKSINDKAISPEVQEFEEFLISLSEAKKDLNTKLKHHESLRNNRIKYPTSPPKPINNTWLLIEHIKSIWNKFINWMCSPFQDDLKRNLRRTKHFWETYSYFINANHSRHTPRLSDAQIIFMGEHHTLNEHEDMETGILNQYASDGDFLLVEGVFETEWEASSFISILQQGVQAKLNIETWDNKKYFNKTGALLKKAFDVRNNPSIPFDRDRYNTKMKKYSDKRNQALENKVSSLLKAYPDKKIFIIAGEAHVNPKALEYDIRDHLEIPDPSIKSAIIGFSKNFKPNTDDYVSGIINRG